MFPEWKLGHPQEDTTFWELWTSALRSTGSRAAGEVGLVAPVTVLCDSHCHSWRVLQKAASLSSPPQLLAASEKKKQWIYFSAFPPFRWARDVPTWPWSTTCWSQFRGSLSTDCCWQVGSQTLPARGPWLPLLSTPFLSMPLPTLHDPLPDRWVKSLELSCFHFCEHHVHAVTSGHSCRVCHHMYTLTCGHLCRLCALCSDALSP